MPSGRLLLLPAAALCVFLAACRRSADASAAHGLRPNLLLITLDTTRADRLGCYGSTQALTTALDGLAARGTRFEHAYTVCPITLPAHATLLTGLYPVEHGLRTNGGELKPGTPTLASILRSRGYRTAAVIASGVLGRNCGLTNGFDYYDDRTPGGRVDGQDEGQGRAPYRLAEEIANSAIAWLSGIEATGASPHLPTSPPKTKNQEPRTKNRNPWFLWAHFYDPHLPSYDHSDRFGNRFSHPYDSEVAYMDQEIGRILDHLDATGQEEDTLVVAVADHGESLGEHGEQTHAMFLYDATLRIPLIVAGPGVRRGQVVDDAVSLAHLPHAILSLLGIESVLPHAGVAALAGHVASLLSTEATGREPAAGGMSAGACYAETEHPRFHANWAPLRCLVEGQWKYVRAPRPELYDLAADPSELRNLAGTEAARLRDLDGAMAEIESRLVPGEPAERVVSASEQRLLESLGYAAGGSGSLPENPPDAKDMLAWDAVNENVISRLRQGEQTADLVASARKLVSASPMTHRYRFTLGRVLDVTGDTGGALAEYREALRLRPDFDTARRALAILLVRRREYAEAIRHFEFLVEKSPDDAQARSNLEHARRDGAAQRLDKWEMPP
jgi:arylsulfatase A-like enzyme